MKKIKYLVFSSIFSTSLAAQIPDPCTGSNLSLAKSVASPCNCEEAQLGSSCNKTLYLNQSSADADIQSFFSTQFGYGQPTIPVPWQDLRASNMMVDAIAPGVKHEFSTEFTTGASTISIAVINIFQVRSGCAGVCQNYIITKKSDPCGTNFITPTLIPSGTTPSFNYRSYAVAPSTTYIITRQVVYDGNSGPCFSSWTGTDGSPSGGAKVTAQHWFIWSVTGALATKNLKLSARQINNSAVLNWSTEEELNTESFTAEKSVDGMNFTEINKVPAAGFSISSKNYQAVDNHPSSTNYYRIKTKNKTGEIYYSDITRLNLQIGIMSKIKINPNPVNDIINISIESKSAKTEGYKILNVNGQIVDAGSINLQKGISRATIKFSQMLPGVYFFTTNVDGQKETIKFFKN